MSILGRLIPKIRARKQLRFGLLRINLTQRGFSSWGLGKGNWTWNERTRNTTYNYPGPGSLAWPGKRSAKRKRARRDT